jgi:hypothetical protein
VVNEKDEGFWTDVQLLKWANDGIVDIVGKTWCIADSELITLATGTIEYALVNSTIATVAVVYNGAKGLVVGHPSMLGNVHDVGEPVYYYIFNNYLGVIPAPPVALNGKKCQVLQVPLPSEIGTDGSVVLPSYLDDCLQMYVLWKAFKKDNRASDAKEAEGKYEKDVRFYRSDILQRRMSEYETKAK